MVRLFTEQSDLLPLLKDKKETAPAYDGEALVGERGIRRPVPGGRQYAGKKFRRQGMHAEALAGLGNLGQVKAGDSVGEAHR